MKQMCIVGMLGVLGMLGMLGVLGVFNECSSGRGFIVSLVRVISWI